MEKNSKRKYDAFFFFHPHYPFSAKKPAAIQLYGNFTTFFQTSVSLIPLSIDMELILLIYPSICAKNDIAPFIIHE